MLWPLTSLCLFCTCELTNILCAELISCVDHRVDFCCSRTRMLTDPKDAVSPGPETGPLRKSSCQRQFHLETRKEQVRSPEWEQVCHVSDQPQVGWLVVLFEAEGGTDMKSRVGFLTETRGAFQAHDGVRDTLR